MAKRKKKSRGVSLLEMAVIMGVVLVLMVFMIGRSRVLERENEEYVHRINNIEKEITQEQKRAEEIQELQSEVNTPEHAEKYAKEHFGLVGEDEILFRPEN